MKKQILLSLSALLTLTFGVNAQTVFLNDGANITIEPGAVLRIEGTLENSNSGTIDNDGRIEVEGDFLNNATFDGTDPNTIYFFGSDDSDMTSNSGVFDSIVLDKDATYSLILNDDLTIGGTGAVKFLTNQNYVSVGNNNLIMQDGAVFMNADNDNYVITGGDGYLRFEDVGASETVTYPVGYDASTYNPAELATTGANTTDDYDVRVLEHAYEDGTMGTQLTNQVTDATWEIVEGSAGGSEVAVDIAI